MSRLSGWLSSTFPSSVDRFLTGVAFASLAVQACPSLLLRWCWQRTIPLIIAHDCREGKFRPDAATIARLKRVMQQAETASAETSQFSILLALTFGLTAVPCPRLPQGRAACSNPCCACSASRRLASMTCKRHPMDAGQNNSASHFLARVVATLGVPQ